MADVHLLLTYLVPEQVLAKPRNGQLEAIFAQSDSVMQKDDDDDNEGKFMHAKSNCQKYPKFQKSTFFVLLRKNKRKMQTSVGGHSLTHFWRPSECIRFVILVYSCLDLHTCV